MAQCENCNNAIRSPEKAIHDGEHWFCDHRCLGQWTANQSGSVPA